MPEDVTEIALLRQINEQLTRRCQLLESAKEQLEQEVKLLKEKVDLLIRRIFGTKSEKLDAAQLELLLSGLEVGKALASEGQPTPEAEAIIQVVKAAAKGAAQRARRERWPTDLPVEQQFIDPEEVRANPDAYRYIGQEVNEQLDYEPVRFWRRQLIRRKYVSVQEVEGAPVIAPLAQSLQERFTFSQELDTRKS